MVVYRAKRAKSGNMMYFKDGKITSKAKYQARPKNNKSRSRTKSKGSNTNRKNGVKNNMKGIPHPSLTGMASGLAVAAYLNAGTSPSRTGSGVIIKGTDNVIKDVSDGELGKAFNQLSKNAINMIASAGGR